MSPLPRLQLYELEDHPRFPAVLRDACTDYLRFVSERLGAHRIVAPKLIELLEDTEAQQIVDLCSGGAGPMALVAEELSKAGIEPDILLTDKYPNRSLSSDHLPTGVRLVTEPVDALAVPAELSGLRTIFNGLHHFSPSDARTILADAAQAGAPIAVFEIVERKLSSVASMLLVPFIVWAITPFIRPFRWSRLLWTYPVPAVPFVALHDGVVSQLRAYTPSELLELANEATTTTSSHSWESGVLSGTSLRITYLIGRPRS